MISHARPRKSSTRIEHNVLTDDDVVVIEGIGTFRPYIPQFNRHLELSVLENLLGTTLGLKAVAAIARHCAQLARKTCVSRSTYFANVGRWICDQRRYDQFRDNTSLLGKIASIDEWEEIIHAWASAMREKYSEQLTTLGEINNQVNRILDILELSGLAPTIEKPTPPKGYRKTKSTRKTLVEVASIHPSAKQNASLITTALLKATGNLKLDSDAEGFISSIANSENSANIQSEERLMQIIHATNRQRLIDLRKLAEDHFIKWHDIYNEGQRLLSLGESDVAEQFSEAMKRKIDNTSTGRNAFLKKIFPRNNKELAKANFLRLIADEYSGQVPPENSFQYPYIFKRVVYQLGSKYELDGMLSPHLNAVVAAILMYLIDTGANVSVALALKPDYESPCDDPRFVRISSTKDRSGGKAIVDQLPIKDPTVRISTVYALREINRMSEMRRKQYPELNNVLFINPFFEENKPVNDRVLANRLKYMLRDSKQLADLPIKPSYIRPSFLLDLTLSNNGNIATAKIKAQHVNAHVTEGYTLRYPTRVLYEQKIREFQNLYQIVIIHNIPNACETFGISEIEAQGLLEKSHRTGIGLLCKDPHSGHKSGTTPGQLCTKVGECLDCSQHLFYASVENIVDMLMLRAYLLQQKDEWEISRKNRWESVWLQFIAFSEVAIEKLKRGPTAKLFADAESIVASKITQNQEFPHIH